MSLCAGLERDPAAARQCFVLCVCDGVSFAAARGLERCSWNSFLSLVSEEEIHQTLRMMGQPTNALLTPEIAREVCQRTGSAASLNGSIALIGTKYNLILKAVSCANGDLLASARAQVGDQSRVLDAAW